jgi:hypothetical protein
LKSLFLLISFILLSISHYAQNFAIGTKIGVTFSSLYKVSQDYTFKPGLVTGISGQFKVSNHFFLLSELKYEQKGAKIKIEKLVTIDPEHPYMDFIGKSKYNYLTLSILAKPHFGKKEIFYFSAGPFLGYLMNAWSEDKFIDHSNGELISEDVKNLTSADGINQINKFDFGLATNAGVSFSIIRNTKLFFEVIYNMSFTSINKLTSPRHIGVGFNSGLIVNLQ